MAKKNVKPFVLNDDTVANSYGFYILTSGIDLERFIDNPVMLSDHYNSSWNVIGNWQNITQEENRLTASPEFDTEDPDTAKIAGKVTRGYLKGCSMGITFNPDDLQLIGGKLILTKCELYEASIVPVPSNKRAVRLYNSEGVIMQPEEIQTLCLSAKQTENFKKNDSMKKVMLSVAAFVALGYDTKNIPQEGIEESEVNSKVMSLAVDNENLKRENDALKLAAQQAKEAQEAVTKTRVTTAVELAITQGKIGADKKEQFVNLGIANEEVLNTTLAAIPAKQDFAAGITTPSGTGTGTEVKTVDDFAKLSLEQQLAFKEAKPEAYKNLFNN